MPQEKEGRRLCCNRANIAAELVRAVAASKLSRSDAVRSWLNGICKALVQDLGQAIGVERRKT
jgi:hypothetical protein